MVSLVTREEIISEVASGMQDMSDAALATVAGANLRAWFRPVGDGVFERIESRSKSDGQSRKKG